MKKILGIISMALVLVLVTGCGLQKTNVNGKVLEKPAKGNCNVFECINKLDTTVNLEEANKTMGFEGKLITEGSNYKVYKWIINSDRNEAVQISFYGNSSSISITFSDEDIKSSKVDFSSYEEIKKDMNDKKAVTYEDIKNKFKVDGVLIEKTSYSSRYRWVNEKGGYINANFNNSTKACTMIMGRI